jgi:hypothetical protein
MRVKVVKTEAIPTITLAEYRQFPQDNLPDSTKYIQMIQYTGNSINQVKAFQAEDPAYYFYDDFFDRKIKLTQRSWIFFQVRSTGMMPRSNGYYNLTALCRPGS